MKGSLRIAFLCLLFVVAMGVGSKSRAESITEEKHPAAAAEAPKPGMKEIPEDLTADANVSFYSQYIWRGLELSRDSLVIFPTLTVGYKGFAINLWADLDTRYNKPNVDTGDREFKIQETDVTLSYSNSVSIQPVNLNYSLGWIYYNYQPGKNQELFLTLGLDTILKPIFCVYSEIETGQAWYLMAGVSHSMPFPEMKDWSLDLAFTAGYLINRSTEKFDNFHDGNASVDIKIPINKYVSVMPKIQYSFPLSNDARHRIESNSVGLFDRAKSDFLYGGIILDVAI